MKRLLCALGLIGLAACGGSSGGSTTAATQLDNSVDRLNSLAAISREAEPLAAQPPGNATYSGSAIALAGTAIAPGFGAVGDFDLEVDFDGLLTGSANNFVLIADPAGINFEQDDLISADFVSAGRLDGQFDIAGDARGTSEPGVFDLTVDGVIEGADAAFLEFDEAGGVASVVGENQEVVRVIAQTNLTFDGEDGFGVLLGIGGR